jgi:carboxyl-terminal processing protease
MSRSQKVLFAVLAVVSMALTTFAAGVLVGIGRNNDGGSSFRFGGSIGRIEDGQGDEVIADALEQIRSTAVDPPTEEELVRGAIRGMVKVLKKADDPYALFYSPNGYRTFQELTTGKFSGIGVWIKPKGGRLEVVSVLPDTPAQNAGLKRGDIIQSVEGMPVTGMTSDETINRIKGREGTDVEIEITRGKSALSFTITRRAIQLPNLRASLLDGGYGYIRLFGFARGAGDQVREKVTGFIEEGAQGVVLDLRDNGGGLFSEAVGVASVFIESGDVVIYRERGQDDRAFEAEGDAVDIPVVVLVNEGTASASEIVAGALQDRGRAIVVGATTYGKGSVQEITPLVDGSAMKLTTAAYLTPEGRNIDGRGIEPDVEVDGVAAQRQRAIEILEGLVISKTESQG